MTSEKAHISKVSEVFDRWASNGRADGMEAGHLPMARPAFEKLALTAGQRYLDIGCGNGYTVRWAAAIEDVDAIGIDVSESMIKLARERSTHLANTRFIHAPFPLPILKAKTFDAIFSMEVFYYLTDLRWALLSVIRLLKPGGKFACVVDFYEENEASLDWPEKVGVDLNRLSKDEWREAMQEVGFEIVEQCQLTAPSTDGQDDDWRQTVGSLVTIGRRPFDS